LHETFSKEELRTWKFAGASSGSLIAFGLAHGVDFKLLKEFALGMITYAHIDGVFGPANRMTKIVESGVRKFLAAKTIYDDDDKDVVASNVTMVDRLQGRLHISVTLMREYFSFDNRIISDFNDDEDLINILMSSCYIPVYVASELRERK